jgi:hypothetical protein
LVFSSGIRKCLCVLLFLDGGPIQVWFIYIYNTVFNSSSTGPTTRTSRHAHAWLLASTMMLRNRVLYIVKDVALDWPHQKGNRRTTLRQRTLLATTGCGMVGSKLQRRQRTELAGRFIIKGVLYYHPIRSLIILLSNRNNRGVVKPKGGAMGAGGSTDACTRSKRSHRTCPIISNLTVHYGPSCAS